MEKVLAGGLPGRARSPSQAITVRDASYPAPLVTVVIESKAQARRFEHELPGKKLLDNGVGTAKGCPKIVLELVRETHQAAYQCVAYPVGQEPGE